MIREKTSKLDVIEALTRVHFSNYQWGEVNLTGYFDTLREYELGWLIEGDFWKASYMVRVFHQIKEYHGIYNN